MSNRLSYLEESTVEKHQFEQMESKVFTVFEKLLMPLLVKFHGTVFMPLSLCCREEN